MNTTGRARGGGFPPWLGVVHGGPEMGVEAVGFDPPLVSMSIRRASE